VRSDAGHELRWLHVLLTSHSLLTDFETRIPFWNDKQKGKSNADSFASLRNDKQGRLREGECSADADALWE
jgi:hypothetical protein